jgi:predicted nuclease with TOPRIM domain
MREQLEQRLEELRKDFDVGQKRLLDLEAETNHLRETLLRISGAMQVLQELLEPPPPSNGSAQDSAQVQLSAAASPRSSSGEDA